MLGLGFGLGGGFAPCDDGMDVGVRRIERWRFCCVLDGEVLFELGMEGRCVPGVCVALVVVVSNPTANMRGFSHQRTSSVDPPTATFNICQQRKTTIKTEASTTEPIEIINVGLR